MKKQTIRNIKVESHGKFAVNGLLISRSEAEWLK